MTQEEQKLKDFLISKGAFEAYVRNIQSEDCNGVNYIDEDKDPDKMEIWALSSAFRYDLTPEGLDYWYNLSDEYNNTI